MSRGKIELLMEKLDLTEEEAIQLIADDKAIDKGEKLFELSQEGKQIEKQMRQADRAVNAYGKTAQRERKTDNVKSGLIELLTNVIQEQPMCNSLTVINAEREFEFMWAGKKYKIVLSAPRK